MSSSFTSPCRLGREEADGDMILAARLDAPPLIWRAGGELRRDAGWEGAVDDAFGSMAEISRDAAFEVDDISVPDDGKGAFWGVSFVRRLRDSAALVFRLGDDRDEEPPTDKS